jgi:hypothetical protein
MTGVPSPGTGTSKIGGHWWPPSGVAGSTTSSGGYRDSNVEYLLTHKGNSGANSSPRSVSQFRSGITTEPTRAITRPVHIHTVLALPSAIVSVELLSQAAKVFPATTLCVSRRSASATFFFAFGSFHFRNIATYRFYLRSPFFREWQSPGHQKVSRGRRCTPHRHHQGRPHRALVRR